MKLKPASVCLCWIVFLWAGQGGLNAVRAEGGHEDFQRVNLECKIAGQKRELRHSAWRVLVKRENGEPVHISLKLAGTTVKLRNLEPGIYSVCLSGAAGRESCSSIDLTPGKGRASHDFKIELQVPDSKFQPSFHAVHAGSLAVPAAARAELARAENSRMRGDSDAYLHHIQEALGIFPEYADALNNLGAHYHRTHDYAKAIECFKKALAVDPGLYASWINLASSLMSVERFAEALEAAKNAIELKPNEAAAHGQLALAYYYRHNYAGAKEHFRAVIAADPASGLLPQLFLVQMALAERNSPEAADYIRSFLRHHPNSPQVEHMRRWLDNISAGRDVFSHAGGESAGPE